MPLRRRHLLQFGLSLSLLMGAGAQPAPVLRGEYTIPNIGSVKLQMRDYVKTGQYKEEVRYVAGKARDYLEKRLGRPLSGKPAIVLDIDETSLSNYPHIEEVDFGYIAPAWNAWVEQGTAPALEGVLELYKYARAKDVHVIFITGRNIKQRLATENNLRQAGYEQWSELIFKETGPLEAAETYKAGQRRRLTLAGYEILVNVGDQDSDLTGGYAESVYKLPNPMYLVP
jgi:acid phosphatase